MQATFNANTLQKVQKSGFQPQDVTQLAVGFVSVSGAFTLQLSLLNLSGQDVVCPVAVWRILRVLALTNRVHRLCVVSPLHPRPVGWA